MLTAIPTVRRLRLGPRSAGLLLTTAELDRARCRRGWCYELINGVPLARLLKLADRWAKNSGK